MTLKGGTGQACAACKYQRRRCTPECLLAPFFPADDPKMFQNVHRLFGVKNIQNLLKELGPEQKAMAVKSIKFHAYMREKYPVDGCLVEIHQLTYQIQMAEKELQGVLHQLSYYRRHHHHHEMSAVAAAPDEYLSELQLGMAPPGNPTLPVLPDDKSNPPIQISFSGGGNADFCMNFLDFKENNNLCQQTCSSSNENNPPNSMIINSQIIVPHTLSFQQETNLDYNEIHQFFDQIDDTQSYIGSKDAYDSSLESPSGDSRQLVEHIDENELKTAAACFSLTSVN